MIYARPAYLVREVRAAVAARYFSISGGALAKKERDNRLYYKVGWRRGKVVEEMGRMGIRVRG